MPTHRNVVTKNVKSEVAAGRIPAADPGSTPNGSNPGIYTAEQTGLNTVPPWLINELTGEIDIPKTPLVPESNQDYAARQYSEAYHNGDLDPGSDLDKKIKATCGDASKAKTGKPSEVEKEDPKEGTKVLVPSGESPHVLHWVTPNVPHVTTSTAERKARVAACSAPTAKSVVIEAGEYKCPDCGDLVTYPFWCKPCAAYYDALDEFRSDWRAWERENLSHAQIARMIPLLLPAPQPQPEPKVEPEKWETVMEAIGTPIEVVDMENMPGLIPVYCTDFDVPLPTTEKILPTGQVIEDSDDISRARARREDMIAWRQARQQGLALVAMMKSWNKQELKAA